MFSIRDPHWIRVGASLQPTATEQIQVHHWHDMGIARHVKSAITSQVSTPNKLST